MCFGRHGCLELGELNQMSELKTIPIAIEKYRPSNGTEGDFFMDAWCRHCARDKAMSEGMDLDDCDDNDFCRILNDTQRYGVDHPKYPIEWQYKDGQPICTAFIQAGEPVPPPRCQHTLELF